MHEMSTASYHASLHAANAFFLDGNQAVFWLDGFEVLATASVCARACACMHVRACGRGIAGVCTRSLALR